MIDYPTNLLRRNPDASPYGDPLQAIGLGNMLGGSFGWTPSEGIVAQQFIDRHTTVDDTEKNQLIKTAALLSKVITKLGGPKPDDPEYLTAPSVQPFQVEKWTKHISQLAEEVAWRAGEPLPRVKP